MTIKAREINQQVRYTAWSVFSRLDPEVPADAVDEALAGLQEIADESDLVIRGWYDVSLLRADADLMVWWHSDSPQTLQRAYHRLRAGRLGQTLQPTWSSMGLHRPAEFNKGHVPAFLAGEEARDHICVYPFVRSLEWYLLPDEERRELLVEHGMMGREYPDVRANTVSAFALGDYEWLLAFEADELHRIVDLMRHLRSAAARRHTRLEIPFFTGRRAELAEIVASWAG